MSRVYHSNTSEDVRGLLDRLIEPGDRMTPSNYREAMFSLGAKFVESYRPMLAEIQKLLLICTNEDADFLAEGVLNGLEAIPGLHTSLACFWNERIVTRGTASGMKVDMAPIVRRYLEPGEVDAFLVVKSIISSGCVVRTNIAELVYDLNPSRILVFAPVILEGGQAQVSEEFDSNISDRFEFYWFAQDDEKDGENVVPGIGGQVYERLGLGTKEEKNRYTPNLVKQRRLHPTPH